ncbi:hypothetical protein K3495_g11255 [Podosphaera aphanis]|nr:hypothetical protein K3495_g11255 [Podosphaera aphanis]
MHSIYFVLAVLSATSMAVPLNINLGAYSPAVVVGDGEISFGEGESASANGLIETLAGASVGDGAKKATGGKDKRTTAKTTGEGLKDAKRNISEASNDSESERKSRILETLSTTSETTTVKSTEKRDLTGFEAALSFAESALDRGPTIDLGTGGRGSGVGITVKPGGVA